MPNEDHYMSLIINTGSTSTKIAIFEFDRELLRETIDHTDQGDIKDRPLMEQYKLRYKCILDCLEKEKIAIREINCIMARGGLLRPISGGVWRINKKMAEELKSTKYGEHASNLSALIAYDLGRNYNIQCYIADPVVVDEMEEIARISGIPELPRLSIFHALNQKYTAKIVAKQLGKSYENSNLIVVHMGGGITIGAHKEGRVVDVNNGLHGDGPFTPERCGSIPPGQFLSLYLSNKYSNKEIKKLIQGRGGLAAYFGTSNVKKIMGKVKNSKAKIVLDAMIYQIAKYISSLAPIFKGKIDGIVITGGLANSKEIVKSIKGYISFLSPVFVLPGEYEMEALNNRSLELKEGKIKAQEY